MQLKKVAFLVLKIISIVLKDSFQKILFYSLLQNKEVLQE